MSAKSAHINHFDLLTKEDISGLSDKFNKLHDIAMTHDIKMNTQGLGGAAQKIKANLSGDATIEFIFAKPYDVTTHPEYSPYEAAVHKLEKVRGIACKPN
jgi:hypothetical protein